MRTAIILDKIRTIRWELVVVTALLLGVATPAYPQASAPNQISLNELAKQVANPVTSLWSIQFQFNNFALESDKWAEDLLFQPVLPVSLTKDVNLITRPVIPLYESVPHPTALHAADLGARVETTALTTAQENFKFSNKKRPRGKIRTINLRFSEMSFSESLKRR